jgi:tetrahydromethanopterin S-methyltransferase subunit G
MTAHDLGTKSKPLSGSGIGIAWGLMIAVLCVYVENVSLVAESFGKLQSPFPEIAGVCAVIKFALIFIAIGYILYGLVIRMVSKIAKQSAT